MNRSSGPACLTTASISRFILATLVVGAAVAAEAADGKADSPIDALIPMVTLEAEPPPPANLDEKGIKWNGVALASQPVGPVDAILIEESLGKASARRSLLLTLTGKIELDAQGHAVAPGAPAEQVWCRDLVKQNSTLDCYRDSDGDGKLDLRAPGYVPLTEPLSLNRIGAFEAIEPIAYRKAQPAELPRFDVDYLLCSVVGAEIKFARRIKKVGLLAGTESGPCSNAASPLAAATGAPRFLLDGLTIEVATADGVRMARMVAGLPAGTMLGHLRTDRPFTDVAHATRYSGEKGATAAASPDVYMATPPVVATGPVKTGQPFFSVEIKHRFTGTLRAAAIQLKLFKGKPNELIPAGAKLFGIQMRGVGTSTNLDANIVWCYPGPPNVGRTRGKCVAYDQSTFPRVIEIWGRFDVDRIGVGSSDPAIEAPIIDRGDLDFGEPVVLEISVEKIDKKKIVLAHSLDRRSEKDKWQWSKHLLRTKDGKSYVMVGLGLYLLEPVGTDSIQITEKQPASVGEGIDINDAVALQLGLRQ